MAEIYMRVTLKDLQPDFSALLKLAQSYSEWLGCIHIVESTVHPTCTGKSENLTIAVPISYVEYWRAVGDGIKMEHMAEGDLFTRICRVLEDNNCLPAPAWD